MRHSDTHFEKYKAKSFNKISKWYIMVMRDVPSIPYNNYRDGVEGDGDGESFGQQTSQSDIRHSVDMMVSVDKELIRHSD